MKDRRGYLNKDFQLFHLKDNKSENMNYHYHDFNKIIVFLKGNVTYIIEGKSYKLKPWDIVLVNNHDVHKAVIDKNVEYERIIIWAHKDFIEKHNYEGCNLLNCFDLAKDKCFNLVRLGEEIKERMKRGITLLEECMKNDEFGSRILQNARFVEFMVYLNRIYIDNMYLEENEDIRYDKQTQEVIKYINENIEKNISNDEIAEKFFMSKYYVMHKFKNETGYTLHNYIIQKKLFKVKELIEKGEGATKAAKSLGFNDYSSFLRDFKKLFNCSPKDVRQV